MHNGTQKRAVVTRDWHLIRNVVPDGTTELYNLAPTTRAEEHDLSGLGEPAERELSARWRRGWTRSRSRPTSPARRPPATCRRTPYRAARPLGDTLGGSLRRRRRDGSARALHAGERVRLSPCYFARVRSAIPDGWGCSRTSIGAGPHASTPTTSRSKALMPLDALEPGTFVRDRDPRVAAARLAAGTTTLSSSGLWRGARAPRRAASERAPDNAVDVPRSVTVAP